MIVECAWHMKNFGTTLIMGEKEPYENKGVTSGMCSECYKREMAKMKKEPLYPHVSKGQIPSKGPFQFYNAGIDAPIKMVIEIQPLGWLNKQHVVANIDSAKKMGQWIYDNLTLDAAEKLQDELSARMRSKK